MKKKTNWPFFIVASGITVVWQIYEISTAIEAPRQPLAILQYVVVGLAAISCIGSIGMYLSGKP